MKALPTHDNTPCQTAIPAESKFMCCATNDADACLVPQGEGWTTKFRDFADGCRTAEQRERKLVIRRFLQSGTSWKKFSLYQATSAYAE
jgi:hypothetical protein